MITTDIDQFTLVLQPFKKCNFDEWRESTAMLLIDTFILKSNMSIIFQNLSESKERLPEGYNRGFSINNSPFYFCIAYHEAYVRMGVIVKFSAYSWHEYRKRHKKIFNYDINLHSFLKLIDSKEYTFRLSRVDVYCDFINEGIDVSKLKRSIEQGRTEVRYGKY